MSAEEWKVILTDETSDTGVGTAGGTGTGREKDKVTGSKTWGDIGKIAGAVAGVSGALALVIQAVRRSKIFSTFMDTLLTILGAIVDMMLVPLIPFIVPVFAQLAKLLKPAKSIGDLLKALIPDDFGEKLIAGIFGPLGMIMTALVKWIKEALDKLWPDISKWWNDSIKWIGDLWNGLIKNITDWWKSIDFKGTWDQISGWAKKVWDDVSTWSQGVWSAMKDAIAPVWNFIGENFVKYIINPLIEVINTIKFWDPNKMQQQTFTPIGTQSSNKNNTTVVVNINGKKAGSSTPAFGMSENMNLDDFSIELGLGT